MLRKIEEWFNIGSEDKVDYNDYNTTILSWVDNGDTVYWDRDYKEDKEFGGKGDDRLV